MTGADRPSAALELSAVSVPFGPETPEGLKGITITVAPGERLALVGASGVGKSSLLRAVAGLHPLTRGRIEVAGKDVSRASPESRGTVYLGQIPLLFPHLTVLENVAFPLRVRGVARKAREARALELLARVRLEELAERTPEALSGGERHRVALARAVAARPPLLLLDEPFAALDPSLRHEVREAMVALQEDSGAAMVLVTHDLDEAGALAHRIGILLPGELAQLDAPERLFARPASLQVSRFLGYRNEVPVAWSSEAAGWMHPALGVVATAPPPRDGPGKAEGMAVFPPGSVDLALLTPGAPRGRVVAVDHPGPRPRVRVAFPSSPAAVGQGGTLAGAGASDVTLAIDTSHRPLPLPGEEVSIRAEPSRVLVFPT